MVEAAADLIRAVVHMNLVVHHQEIGHSKELILHQAVNTDFVQEDLHVVHIRIVILVLKDTQPMFMM